MTIAVMQSLLDAADYAPVNGSDGLIGRFPGGAELIGGVLRKEAGHNGDSLSYAHGNALLIYLDAGGRHGNGLNLNLGCSLELPKFGCDGSTALTYGCDYCIGIHGCNVLAIGREFHAFE